MYANAKFRAARTTIHIVTQAPVSSKIVVSPGLEPGTAACIRGSALTLSCDTLKHALIARVARVEPANHSFGDNKGLYSLIKRARKI